MTAALAPALLVGCDQRAPGLGPAPSGSVGPAPLASVAEPSPTAPPAASPTPVVSAEPPVPGAPPTFADLAARVDSAVVYVETMQEQTGVTGRRRVVGGGVGSGFVYDPAGYVLTNHHVIADATSITLKFRDGREIPAQVVGRDPPTDVAVLRVEATGLAHVPLGDSDAARVGDWVVAIGNPFGLAHTVSAGIISAKGRTGSDVVGLGDPSGYYSFLQTDAGINPGNSGGPLIDLQGRVVGINTAIRARANSIGFAIPVNMIKELLPHLLRDGKVRRSAIGISVSSILPADASRLGLAGTNGALVQRVLPGGAGDRAGLQIDDVIVAIDGAEIARHEKLRWVTSLAGVGRRVTLRVIRGGRTLDLAVTLGELPEQPAIPQGEEEP
ncbi:MAG: trypsin-like peptidase domain-containing protein [Polyangiaceae bacterium]|nr:trypsin-like peptidase domain-containing protein [Polyangiaceae bacterium]